MILSDNVSICTALLYENVIHALKKRKKKIIKKMLDVELFKIFFLSRKENKKTREEL